MIDSWFDPAKEAAATETLINLGCDIVTTHTDSPAALQIWSRRGFTASGRAPTCRQFAPHAHLTAIEDIWGPYYTERAQAVLDGTWKSDGYLGRLQGRHGGDRALQSGDARRTCRPKPTRSSQGYKDGTYNIFTGPIKDQDGQCEGRGRQGHPPMPIWP